ncbi:Uncharacterized protein OS=Isosphaera pallida (strain ATCC 43644 / DSM 9630 / IS1B) GN=Isop_2437 PE=4 SV=1 [Gemmataceae bacterium]|nr:Uncharacterized protein OS=Isosphaera pallida (strain ATCC 43644 / DSM 9630 / IS1B) GN=Isop_2437 PE=4 SV=1 [Gemmataceae bacterium]VTU02479.1 Uncharacterized protein OS=Isosphaera pallida (strain ATCC 43644 / DSM 9630 / IS1B) GN=Isop_2437 PE=4 SV=1 [Gemmataceae bacterium]
MTGSTKSQLSPARRALVELLHRVNFGRLEHLEVRGGEPVLDPRPRVVREHKFGGDNGPRSEAARADVALKAQHLDLMRLLDRVSDGVIDVLTVKHGLPFHAELAG